MRVERKWTPLPLVPADMNQPLVKSMRQNENKISYGKGRSGYWPS